MTRSRIRPSVSHATRSSPAIRRLGHLLREPGDDYEPPADIIPRVRMRLGDYGSARGVRSPDQSSGARHWSSDHASGHRASTTSERR